MDDKKGRWHSFNLFSIVIGSVMLAVLVSFPAVAQAPVTPVKSTTPQGHAEIDPVDLELFLDEFFNAQMDELHVPGVAITVVDKGEIILANGQSIQTSYNRACNCEGAFSSDRSNLPITRRLPRRPSASSQ